MPHGCPWLHQPSISACCSGPSQWWIHPRPRNSSSGRLGGSEFARRRYPRSCSGRSAAQWRRRGRYAAQQYAHERVRCALDAVRQADGTLRRSPMSATEVATIIKLQPTARAYRIIPLCTRGRSICLQQTELIASQAVSYYCFIPRPPAPCAPPGPPWTRLRAGRASPLFATRALTLPPSVPLIRRTLFDCGRVNPIAPPIAGRRREYQCSE